MAISSGVGPHAAWLNFSGESFPIEHGNVSQSAENKTATFAGVIPLSLFGAREAFTNLVAGVEATITVQARGQTGTLVTGEIDKYGFDYIGRKIHFTGRDKSAKLHEETSSEKWLNKKPSEIVQDLAGRAGLSTGKVSKSSVQAGKQLEKDYVKLSQGNTFAKVIQEMARIDGARWWVDPQGQFHYTTDDSDVNSYSINVNEAGKSVSSDCEHLVISTDVQAGRPTEVTVKGYHPKKRETVSSVSNVQGKGPKRSFTYHVPTIDMERALRHSKSEAANKCRHEITASVTIVGDPSVHAGMKLQLNGTDFDQSLDIDTAHHDFGMSGYKTHITAKSAKSGRTASEGEVPIVTSVDGKVTEVP